MNLDRFVKAQEIDYEFALKEIIQGKKRSHWMWYIFPQLKGLGYSSMAVYYGIKNHKEAEGYLAHPVLGARLLEISNELLKLEGKSAKDIFGSTDELKLKSCMTLFYLVSKETVFREILDKYFDGNIDEKTQEILLKNKE